MNKLTLALSALLLCPMLGSSQTIHIRVSVKFILDGGGQRAALGSLNSDADVRAQIDAGNSALNATGRGYRLDLLEIVDLSGVAQWFSVPVVANKAALEAAAEAAPGPYAYRYNAVNIYINGSTSSGVCSFPDTGEDIIFLGQGALSTTVIHEIGHYMKLCHTQGCPCGDCNSCASPQDDHVADTLPDRECWSQNDISQAQFQANYAALSASDQTRVDNVFLNIMSYHNTRARFTQGQMDRWASASRANVMWSGCD